MNKNSKEFDQELLNSLIGKKIPISSFEDELQKIFKRTRIPFISLADGAWRNIQMCLDNPLSFSVKQGMACRD